MAPLRFGGRVVIVAGGCGAAHESVIHKHAGLLKTAFARFEGLVICGGTTQGISGVIGDLAGKSKGRIRAVGYLPHSLPTDGTAKIDEKRYHELRRTDGGPGFTAREPIQNWLDLLAAGVRPETVRLLGVNGGNIAGLEYRIAVALGACVGVTAGSGREADRVAGDWPADRHEHSPGKLLVLPADAMTLRAFIGAADADRRALPDETVEQAAELGHRMFLDEQRYKNPDPVMKPWRELRPDIQQSNRGQMGYLVSILRSEGFDVRRMKGAPNDPRFTIDEIERMGEMEHGRWNVERLESGWKFFKERNPAKKLTPHLVSWKKLEPRIQDYDFKNVRRWPQVLAEVGFEIYRRSGRASRP